MLKISEAAFAEYETFVRTVDEGGLSAAGRALGLSPAVVSKRLARLEERLAVRLLERTTRRIALTDAGRVFYDRAGAILDAAEDLEAQVSQRSTAARGLLKVSAPTSFGRRYIAPHLVRFIEDHPRLTLQFDLTDAFVDLGSEGVDVAVRISTWDDQDPLQHWLAPNHRVLCATPGYLERHGGPESLADLREHRLLAADNQTLWRLDTPEGRVALRTRSALRTNSSEAIRETLLAGLGIALRSTWDVAEELRSGALRIVLPDCRGASDVAIHAVTASRARHSARAMAFVAFMRDLYSPEPPWPAFDDRELHP